MMNAFVDISQGGVMHAGIRAFLIVFSSTFMIIINANVMKMSEVIKK